MCTRVWYHKLRNFLCERGFDKRKVDITLFIKKIKDHTFTLIEFWVTMCYDHYLISQNLSCLIDIKSMVNGIYVMKGYCMDIIIQYPNLMRGEIRILNTT